MHKKGGGLLQPRAKREMLNTHGGGELEDEKGRLNSITSTAGQGAGEVGAVKNLFRTGDSDCRGVASQYSDIS
jgi:hypothetical protein